jgi:hypothetical protein
MIAKIICPNCQTLGQFSVEAGNYKGPYRCWKCRTLYTLDMVNNEVISLQPLTEKELEEIKANQEAQKGGKTEGVMSQTNSQAPMAYEYNPVVWPKVSDRVIEENKPPEFPKQSFVWPKVPKSEPDITTPSEKQSAIPQTPFILPGEKAQRKSNGVILFQTIAMLTESEKLLTNEGCTITRITAPVNPPSGSNIALRFPWSQYETVKSVLDKAGIQTQGIRQL